MAEKPKAILLAITAAVLYALSTPFSKFLMTQIPPSFMAGLLYLGAGLGMIPLCFVKNISSSISTRRITRQDLPYIFGMVSLDIAAPIFLMTALIKVSAVSSASVTAMPLARQAVMAAEKVQPAPWLKESGIFGWRFSVKVLPS